MEGKIDKVFLNTENWINISTEQTGLQANKQAYRWKYKHTEGDSYEYKYRLTYGNNYKTGLFANIQTTDRQSLMK